MVAVHGGWTPGVVVVGGGMRRDTQLEQPIMDHGTVLYTSSTLKANERFEARTNVAGKRPMERLGDKGGYTKGCYVFAGGAPHDVPAAPPLNHGTVLYVSKALEEKHGRRGGSNSGLFQPGVHVMAGGEPHEVPMVDNENHGTVLCTSKVLRVDPNADDGEVNERGERHGSGHGGFTHGVVEGYGGPLRVPHATPKADLEELKHGRRNGSGHYISGVSIMLGGTPKYTGVRAQ